MEENVNANTEASQSSPEMAKGGDVGSGSDGVPSNFTDDNSKLGWIGIMLLGLTTASLIYSIFYYRKRMQHLEKGENKLIQQLRQDVDEIKEKLGTLSGGKKVQYGRFA